MAAMNGQDKRSYVRSDGTVEKVRPVPTARREDTLSSRLRDTMGTPKNVPVSHYANAKKQQNITASALQDRLNPKHTTGDELKRKISRSQNEARSKAEAKGPAKPHSPRPEILQRYAQNSAKQSSPTQRQTAMPHMQRTPAVDIRRADKTESVSGNAQKMSGQYSAESRAKRILENRGMESKSATPRQSPNSGSGMRRKAAPENARNPKQTELQKAKAVPNRRKPEQKQAKKPANNGWVIPEGSPIYTARGTYYEKPTEAQRRAYEQRRRTLGEAGKAQKKRKKKKLSMAPILWGLKVFFVRLLIFFIICSLAGAWWYKSQFFSAGGVKGSDVTYTVDDGKKTIIEASASGAYKDGVLYMNFSELSDSFNMAMVGSLDSMRFIVYGDGATDSAGDGTEQYVIFTDSSRTASVNGCSVVMEAGCRVIGDDIWVPLSFAENYMNGIEIERRSGGVNITSSQKAQADKDDKNKEKDDTDYPIHIDLTLKRADALNSVSYPG